MLFWAALLLLLQHKHQDLPGIWDKDLDFGLNTTFTPRELSRVGLEAFHRAARVQSRSATILYRASTATLLHFRLSLLFMSGNIESNPSPQYKFPCGVCSKPVKTSQKSICCDSCDRWYHTQCCSVGDHIYEPWPIRLVRGSVATAASRTSLIRYLALPWNGALIIPSPRFHPPTLICQIISLPVRIMNISLVNERENKTWENWKS